jgi:hypothetical protein
MLNINRKKYQYKTIDGRKKRIHRHIMEERLGRFLESNEHVYHLNGDSQDNSIENLVVIVKKEKK